MWGGIKLIDFIDKTSESGGTPISRKNMMAIQGFISSNIQFNDDGSIVETNENGEALTTTFNDDGSIVETFVGEKTITKTTRFNADGSILEVIS
jgi:hypothetical protein